MPTDPTDDYFRPPQTRAALWRETAWLVGLVAALTVLLGLVVFLTEL
ncbi:hypothetical protein BH11ACT8_BH11ACT8_12890 [soil metagenome]